MTSAFIAESREARLSRTFLKELRFHNEVANLQTAIGDKQGTTLTFLTMLELARAYDTATYVGVATNVALKSPAGATIVAAKFVRRICNLYLR